MVSLCSVVFLQLLDATADERHALQIPAAQADVALKELARQSGYPVIFRTSEVAAVRTNAVAGRFTVSDALGLMLEGTPLVGGLSLEGVVTASLRHPERPRGESTMGNEPSDTRVPLLRRVGTAIATTLFAASGAAAVAAEDATADSRSGYVLEEVVVIAKEVRESLLEVPISVTAFSTEEIEHLQITTNEDLEVRVPGLQFGYRSPATIRGIGSLFGAESAVAIYYDDLYVSYPISGMFGVLNNFYDLESVEVLRGPQGTLFGKSAVAGAVSYTSRRPQREFGAGVTAEAASYDGRRVNAFVTGPLNDSLAYRVTGGWEESDGAQENLAGPNTDGRGSWNISPQIALHAGNLSLNVKYTHVDVDAGLENEVPLYFHDPSLPFYINPAGELDEGAPNAYFGFYRDRPVANDGGDLKNVVELNRPSTEQGERDSVSLNLDYRLSETLSLRYIMAWQDASSVSSLDTDTTPVVGSAEDPFLAAHNGLPFQDLWATINQEIDNTSHEFQLTYDTDRLTARIGAYLFEDNQALHLDEYDAARRGAVLGSDAVYLDFFELPWALVNQFFLGGDGDRFYIGEDSWVEGVAPDPTGQILRLSLLDSSESTAFYGQVNYQISERMHLTVGLRHTEDDRTSEQPPFWFVGPLLGLPGEAVRFVFPGEPRSTSSSSKTTASISVDYAPAANQLWFGSISTGFRAGGVNTGWLPGMPERLRNYDDEELVAYEAGYKADFGDSLRLLVSGFYYDFDGYHQDPLHRVELGGSRLNANLITSLPKANLYGLEVEGTWIPAPNFRISGFYAYQMSEMGSIVLGNQRERDQEWVQVNYVNELTGEEETAFLAEEVDLEGNELPYMPNHKWSLTADYNRDLGPGGSLLASLSYSYTDERHSYLFNSSSQKLDSYTRLDGSLTYAPRSERFSVTLYVENMLDEIMVQEIEANDWEEGYYVGGRLTDARFVGLVVRWEM